MKHSSPLACRQFFQCYQHPIYVQLQTSQTSSAANLSRFTSRFQAWRIFTSRDIDTTWGYRFETCEIYSAGFWYHVSYLEPTSGTSGTKFLIFWSEIRRGVKIHPRAASKMCQRVKFHWALWLPKQNCSPCDMGFTCWPEIDKLKVLRSIGCKRNSNFHYNFQWYVWLKHEHMKTNLDSPLHLCFADKMSCENQWTSENWKHSSGDITWKLRFLNHLVICMRSTFHKQPQISVDWHTSSWPQGFPAKIWFKQLAHIHIYLWYMI